MYIFIFIVKNFLKIHYKDLAHVIMKAGKCRIFRVNWLVSWKSRGPWRASVTVWSLQTGSQSHQSELHPGCVLVSNQEIRPCPLWLPASYEFPTSKKDKDAFLLLLDQQSGLLLLISEGGEQLLIPRQLEERAELKPFFLLYPPRMTLAAVPGFSFVS